MCIGIIALFFSLFLPGDFVSSTHVCVSIQQTVFTRGIAENLQWNNCYRLLHDPKTDLVSKPFRNQYHDVHYIVCTTYMNTMAVTMDFHLNEPDISFASFTHYIQNTGLRSTEMIIGTLPLLPVVQLVGRNSWTTTPEWHIKI